MEPEGSLLHSQAPTICPCPESEQSSLCPHPTSWRCISIFSFHLCLGLPSGLLSLGFPTKTLYARPHHMCYMPHPSHSSWFNEEYGSWNPLCQISMNFNVSPCFFQFNNWWIPTHALFHIQHCISLECWF